MNEREMKKENWPLTLLLVLLENTLFSTTVWSVLRCLTAALLQVYNWSPFYKVREYSTTVAPFLIHNAGDRISNPRQPKGQWSALWIQDTGCGTSANFASTDPNINSLLIYLLTLKRHRDTSYNLFLYMWLETLLYRAISCACLTTLMSQAVKNL